VLLKKVTVYGLIFLISFIYTYETICVLTKVIGDDHISWVDSMECERGAEPGESKEQKEKVDFLEHVYHNNHFSMAYIGLFSFDTSQNISFSSSDYSQMVYSPPEGIS